MANICAECGEQVDPKASFCPACLASTSPVPASATIVAPPAAQTPQLNPSKLPWIIIFVLVALLAGFGYRMVSEKKPATEAAPQIAVEAAPTQPAAKAPVVDTTAVQTPKPSAPQPKTAMPTPTQAPTEPVAATIAKTCTVADPTGTPLNLRSAPGGNILAQLPNGQGVDVIKTITGPKGRTWALIVTYDGEQRQRGWVFREFVSCRD